MNQNSSQVTIHDRRGKPRIICHYPAVIHGIDRTGKKYEEHGELMNLSSTGMFLSLNRSLEPGEKLVVTVLLTNSSIEDEAQKLATKGVVMRTESHPDGACGAAIRFQSYRFV